MKILFYISTIRGGGAARVMTNLANELSLDNEVYFVTNFSSNHEYELSNNIHRYLIEKSESKDCVVIKNFKRIRKLRLIIKSIQPNVSVAFMAENNFRLILAALGLKTKTIISIRNDPKKEYEGFISSALAKSLFKKADGVVFQTEDAKNFFSMDIQKKSKIIFNQVDSKFFQKSEGPGKYIVACGRLSKQKNYPMLLKAFVEVHKTFPKEMLLIYGEGEQKNELVDLVDNYNLNDVVKFMGFSKNMQDVYKEAKMLVMTSDYEGVPNVVLEALASSVPVISTDCPCGGPRMMIEDGKNGYLVPVGSFDILADRIKYMLNDDNYLKFKDNAFKSSEVVKPENVLVLWKDFIYNI